MTDREGFTKLEQDIWPTLWMRIINNHNNELPMRITGRFFTVALVSFYENTGCGQSKTYFRWKMQGMRKFHLKYAVNFPRRDSSDLAGVERLVSASERWDAARLPEASRAPQQRPFKLLWVPSWLKHWVLWGKVSWNWSNGGKLNRYWFTGLPGSCEWLTEYVIDGCIIV